MSELVLRRARRHGRIGGADCDTGAHGDCNAGHTAAFSASAASTAFASAAASTGASSSAATAVSDGARGRRVRQREERECEAGRQLRSALQRRTAVHRQLVQQRRQLLQMVIDACVVARAQLEDAAAQAQPLSLRRYGSVE